MTLVGFFLHILHCGLVDTYKHLVGMCVPASPLVQELITPTSIPIRRSTSIYHPTDGVHHHHHGKSPKSLDPRRDKRTKIKNSKIPYMLQKSGRSLLVIRHLSKEIDAGEMFSIREDVRPSRQGIVSPPAPLEGVRRATHSADVTTCALLGNSPRPLGAWFIACLV